MNPGLAGAWISTLAFATVILATRIVSAQAPTMGIDADPAGNTAKSLASVENCVSVSNGDSFQIDLFITGVNDLKAWEAYITFDGDIVNVTDVDVSMFQAANSGSDVFDASGPLPDTSGLYQLGAIDIGDPAASDSGSGVLARITLTAVQPGLSPAVVTVLDTNRDGRVDLGPRLSDSAEGSIGDSDGDNFFDGRLDGAQIVVDGDCPGAPSSIPRTTPAAATATAAPTEPTPGTSEDSNDSGIDWGRPALVVVYAAAGIVALLAMAGLAFLALGRHRGGK